MWTFINVDLRRCGPSSMVCSKQTQILFWAPKWPKLTHIFQYTICHQGTFVYSKQICHKCALVSSFSRGIQICLQICSSSSGCKVMRVLLWLFQKQSFVPSPSPCSLARLFLSAHFDNANIFFVFYSTSYFNEEVYSTEPSFSVSVPDSLPAKQLRPNDY